MEAKPAVYTKLTECQDCYKCLRGCPVKAISVRGGHASVEPDLCIACGRCVELCPSHAKSIRSDLQRAQHLINSGRAVYAALAPSWIAEFKGVDSTTVITALRKLGFAGVCEVALGAQDVSAWTALLFAQQRKLWLSSACPVCVDYLRKYRPEFVDNITPLASPAVSTGSILRREYGNDIDVVFIGPCIAKKNEAVDSEGVVNLALTFAELREWFAARQMVLQDLAVDTDEVFAPSTAADGRLYPIEGGMIETLRPHISREGIDDIRFICISGLDKLEKTLEEVEEANLPGTVFIECLACSGGCLGGPGMKQGRADLGAVLDIIEDKKAAHNAGVRPVGKTVSHSYRASPVADLSCSESDIQNAMWQMGKESVQDELNCGGCGYDTCRDFAVALVKKRAEPQMCVSYMRRLAQKKANALLRSMPSGVVIVNEDMEIIECNEAFAHLFGEDTEVAFQAIPGLNGAALENIVPFGELFRASLRSGKDIQRDHMEHAHRLFNLNIFNIEPGKTVGAVIQDVTNQEIKREQIARRAKEIINKNIATVQEIACLLGEHVSDTEILLSTIADDYSHTSAQMNTPKE